MTFTLHVDGERWRAHTERTRDAVRAAIAHPHHVDDQVPGVEGDLVAVTKGNGYGLGIARCAREAQRLGLTRIAVGTVFEVAEAASAYDGDIIVLTPFEPLDAHAAQEWTAVASAPHADRVVRTVSSRAAWDVLAAGPGPVRVVLEAITSIGRFGLEPDELRALMADPATLDAVRHGRVRIEGLALHEPMTQPEVDRRAVAGSRWHDASVAPLAPEGASRRAQEVLAAGLGWQQLLADLSDRLPHDHPGAADAEALTELTTGAALWVSHLDDPELAAVRAGLPDIAIYARIGTRLWHGDRGALQARGTVLAVHRVTKGQAVGYYQHRAPRGAIVVIGGGTSHGVALEAPSAASTGRQRIVAAGTGVLAGVGKSLSPFEIGGKHRWFAEPPHMHVSLVAVPEDVPLPSVGDEVPVTVRFATTYPDRVLGLD